MMALDTNIQSYDWVALKQCLLLCDMQDSIGVNRYSIGPTDQESRKGD